MFFGFQGSCFRYCITEMADIDIGKSPQHRTGKPSTNRCQAFSAARGGGCRGERTYQDDIAPTLCFLHYFGPSLWIRPRSRASHQGSFYFVNFKLARWMYSLQPVFGSIQFSSFQSSTGARFRFFYWKAGGFFSPGWNSEFFSLSRSLIMYCINHSINSVAVNIYPFDITCFEQKKTLVFSFLPSQSSRILHHPLIASPCSITSRHHPLLVVRFPLARSVVTTDSSSPFLLSASFATITFPPSSSFSSTGSTYTSAASPFSRAPFVSVSSWRVGILTVGSSVLARAKTFQPRNVHKAMNKGSSSSKAHLGATLSIA